MDDDGADSSSESRMKEYGQCFRTNAFVKQVHQWVVVGVVCDSKDIVGNLLKVVGWSRLFGLPPWWNQLRLLIFGSKAMLRFFQILSILVYTCILVSCSVLPTALCTCQWKPCSTFWLVLQLFSDLPIPSLAPVWCIQGPLSFRRTVWLLQPIEDCLVSWQMLLEVFTRVTAWKVHIMILAPSFFSCMY